MLHGETVVRQAAGREGGGAVRLHALACAEAAEALAEAGELGEFAARAEAEAGRAWKAGEWVEWGRLLERAERYRGLQMWALTRAGGTREAREAREMRQGTGTAGEVRA